MPKKDKELSQKETKEETTSRNLYQKLQLIQSQIGQLEKTRENKFQKYFYAAKAKGSAETYAVKYFLQKFFLLPVDSNLDPDAFDSSPMVKEKEEAKLPPKPTITPQQ
ncbi:8533_t:CDS:2, partial [Cetraspora pellucida]